MKRKIIFSLTSLLLVLSLLLIAIPAQAATITRSGDITGLENWTSDNLYVVDGNLTVTSTGALAIQAGTIVKIKPGFEILVQGQLVLQGNSGSPVIFTSYLDDTVGGDTDGTPTLPTPTDWDGLTLNYGGGGATGSFQYATVRYAANGLRVQNASGSTISPPLAHNTFEFNQTGLYLDASDGDIDSAVQDNQFNQNGLGLLARSTSQGEASVSLTDNQFEENLSYPLFLSGNSFPTYSNNTFSANGSQGIAVGDVISRDGVWVQVPIDASPGATILPYVVDTYSSVEQATTLQISAGMVVKFGSSALMEVYGKLDLQSSLSAPVIFTSIHDDAYGGDTDGQVIDPANDPWSGLDLFYLSGLTTADFSHTIFRFATSGLMVDNGSDSEFSPVIHHNTFAYNGYGINMLVGGDGDIQASVHDNLFSGNEYGLVAAASTNVAGSALPAIQNNTFENNVTYPLGLQGSAFPSYSGNTFSGNLHPAISVQGQMHDDGLWESVPGEGSLDLPYVLTGNYQVSKTHQLTLPAGTVVKSGGPALNVNGVLNALGTPGERVVFTSLNDNEFGGVTAASVPALAQIPSPARQELTPGRKRLGELGFRPADPKLVSPEALSAAHTPRSAAPAPGDWAGLAFFANNTLQHALVRYAVFGLRLVNNGSAPMDVHVLDNTFEHNTTGIDLSAPNSGADINAAIEDNQILSNGTGVKVEWSGAYPGVSYPLIHHNNILNNTLAVNNLQPEVVDATNNWWGNASGPYHTTNPAGLGNPVSDRVNFLPWLYAPKETAVRVLLPLVRH
jgi:hypothetical protein